MNTLPPPAYAPVAAPPAKTGPATASLVLGIVAMCIGLIPILGIFALPCAALAIIFGLVCLKRRVRKGFAITGLVTGLIGIVLAIAGIVIVSNAVDHFDKCTDAINVDVRTGTNTSDEACR